MDDWKEIETVTQQNHIHISVSKIYSLRAEADQGKSQMVPAALGWMHVAH